MTTTARTNMQGWGAIPANGDLILIPDNRWQVALLEFVEASPLAGCTTVAPVAGCATVAVTPDRPVVTLSSGERHVWALLDSLVRGGLHDFLGHADARTLAALGSLMARLTTSTAS